MIERIPVPENPNIIKTEWVYKRRPVQKEIHAIMDAHRNSILVAHRRFGKTVVAINQIILRAVRDQIQDGRYGYIAPYRNQAKDIAWSYMKKFTQPLMGRKINESELSIALPGNIRIRLLGADNPDALRGGYFDGLVLDEVAQMRRDVWTQILKPALADRLGWAVFIGTPKGPNLFHELYLEAVADTTGEWAAMMYRVTDTDALPEDEVAKIKASISDAEFRQEFMCDFGASVDNALITLDDAVAATKREYTTNDYIAMPPVFGVDIARFGSDKSVVFKRQGVVSYAPWVKTKADNVEVAEWILSLYYEHQPALIFIDAGQGQGVIDILHRRINCVVEVPFGGGAFNKAKFINRRAEMWYAMREWTKSGGYIPDIPALITELSAPTYMFNNAGKIQLEAKEKIKERIGVSPDLADALALTFAAPVLPNIGQSQQYALRRDNVFEDYDREEYADGVLPSLL